MSLSVILKTDVPGLGQVGDKKNVKDGYARNYLIPRGLAEYSTINATKKFENQKKRIESKRNELLEGAKKLAESVTQVGLVFERAVGQAGRLFGSVTHMDVAEEFARQGARLERKSILMDGPIRTTGEHKIRVRLHSQVIVDIPVKIVGVETQKKSDDENVLAAGAATPADIPEPQPEEDVSGEAATASENAAEPSKPTEKA